jgi:hypothetical protein
LEIGQYYAKKNSPESLKSAVSNAKSLEEKKPPDITRAKTNDKLVALKKYRRAQGLCFKCGEKWGPNHKCPAHISFHAIEEV